MVSQRVSVFSVKFLFKKILIKKFTKNYEKSVKIVIKINTIK